jgi:hypothetical protein
MQARLERAQRLLELAQLRGLRRSARAAAQAYLFSYRSWYLFYRSVPAESPDPPGSEFECRLITAADIEALAVFEPSRQRREFRAWLEQGALVFVAYKDGRPASFQRVSLTVPTGPPLSSVTLGPDQVWGAEAQTLPEFRGQHVGADLRACRDRVVRERGYREYVSSVQSNNLPALILGYGGRRRLVDRVERLDYLCLLGFRRIRRQPDALAALERILRTAGLLAEIR